MLRSRIRKYCVAVSNSLDNINILNLYVGFNIISSTHLCFYDLNFTNYNTSDNIIFEDDELQTREGIRFENLSYDRFPQTGGYFGIELRFLPNLSQ